MIGYASSSTWTLSSARERLFALFDPAIAVTDVRRVGVSGIGYSQAPTLCMEQPPAHHEQVGERRGRFEAVEVLGQTGVASLAKSEHALDHANRVLHLGTDLRFGPIIRFVDFVDPATTAVLAVREVLRPRRSVVNQRRQPLVALVATFQRNATISAPFRTIPFVFLLKLD
jgi:hypothetical protein